MNGRENHGGPPPENEPKCIEIPESEYSLDFVRSSGPGGQKVNKTASKAVLKWNIGLSAMLTDEQKDRIRQYAKNKVNSEDEIVLSAQNERSQSQNKELVISRLHTLVRKALKKKKKRIATKPSRAAKARRMDEKTKISQKKALRKRPEY